MYHIGDFSISGLAVSVSFVFRRACFLRGLLSCQRKVLVSRQSAQKILETGIFPQNRADVDHQAQIAALKSQKFEVIGEIMMSGYGNAAARLRRIIDPFRYEARLPYGDFRLFEYVCGDVDRCASPAPDRYERQ